MSDQGEILQRIRAAAKIKPLFLPHALRQMNRPDRMISTGEIQQVIEKGEIIEDYPEDTRGHSCLMLGYSESGRPINVCGPAMRDEFQQPAKSPQPSLPNPSVDTKVATGLNCLTFNLKTKG